MRTFAQEPKELQRITSTKSTTSSWARFGQSPEVNSMLHSEREIGNQAMRQVSPTDSEELGAGSNARESSRLGHDFSRTPIYPPAAGAIQAKSAINQPVDEYEQEADHISEQVMQTPKPQLQRACVRGGEGTLCQADHLSRKPERLQTKRVRANDLEQAPAPPIVHEVLRSPGQPLDPATRDFIEPRFHHDFSDLRLHTDAKAAESAQSVNALAYTVGNHIVFGEGQFSPHSIAGQRLLSHELTHVVQQAAPSEGAAPSSRTRRTPAPWLQRQPDPRQSGNRQASVEIRWSEDSAELYHRLVSALLRSPGFRGIDASNFRAASTKEPGLLQKTQEFHLQYSMRHPDRKEGQRIKLQVSAYYGASHDIYTSDLKSIQISAVEKPSVAAPPQQTTPPKVETPKPGQRSEPSLSEQANSLLRMCSRMLADADRQGRVGATFAAENKGKALSLLHMEMRGPEAQRPTGTTPLSERAAADKLRFFMDVVLQRTGRYVVEYGRDERGVMQLQRWAKMPDAPPPGQVAPPSGTSTSPEMELEEDIARYKRWYTGSQQIIAAGLAEADPTTPSNILMAAAPFAVVKVAKVAGLVESTEGMVKTARQAERLRAEAKEARRARIIQQSERQRLAAKYARRSSTEYPAETWDYIEQLENSYPALAEIELRPIRRPAVADPWVFNERMQTSQGRFSFEGLLYGRKIQLDDIRPDGWVVEVKFRDLGSWENVDKLLNQMQRHSTFVKHNGLRGVIWEVNNDSTLEFLTNLVRDHHIEKVLPVLVK